MTYHPILAELLPILFIFARVGVVLGTMPGIGEKYVPPRIRVLLSLFIAYLLADPLKGMFPSPPLSDAQISLILLQEVLAGAFIALIIRILLYALDIAGSIISFEIGFSSAQVFNPFMGTQTSTLSTFLGITGITLIFATNLHHLMIHNIVTSYQTFPLGEGLFTHEWGEGVLFFVSHSFEQAVYFSIPYLIILTLFFVSLGLLNRFIPQIQIFFISLPLQITLGLFVLATTITGAFFFFLTYFEEGIMKLMQT